MRTIYPYSREIVYCPLCEQGAPSPCRKMAGLFLRMSIMNSRGAAYSVADDRASIEDIGSLFLDKPMNEVLMLALVWRQVSADRQIQQNVGKKVPLGLLYGMANNKISWRLGISPDSIELYHRKFITRLAAPSPASLFMEVADCQSEKNKPLECRACWDSSPWLRLVENQRAPDQDAPAACGFGRSSAELWDEGAELKDCRGSFCYSSHMCVGPCMMYKSMRG